MFLMYKHMDTAVSFHFDIFVCVFLMYDTAEIFVFCVYVCVFHFCICCMLETSSIAMDPPDNMLYSHLGSFWVFSGGMTGDIPENI